LTRLWPVIALAMIAGCNPPGERSKQLSGGYEWLKHDGESQLIRADGNITLDHVEQARAEGAMIKATVENGAAFEVDTRTGQVRTISGEMQ
jgi:hypothetical protein